MSLSTHVLDTVAGRPAAGVRVALECRDGDGWRSLGSGTTDADGRVRDLASADGVDGLAAGVHRLTFATAAYFTDRGVAAFYPEVSIVFHVTDPEQHHHVPLLLSPFAYSTYRGS